MRALASIGIFEEVDMNEFKHNATSLELVNPVTRTWLDGLWVPNAP